MSFDDNMTNKNAKERHNTHNLYKKNVTDKQRMSGGPSSIVCVCFAFQNGTNNIMTLINNKLKPK